MAGFEWQRWLVDEPLLLPSEWLPSFLGGPQDWWWPELPEWKPVLLLRRRQLLPIETELLVLLHEQFLLATISLPFIDLSRNSASLA